MVVGDKDDQKYCDADHIFVGKQADDSHIYLFLDMQK